MSDVLELHPIGGCSPSRLADIIFIHGLDGDPFATWRHPQLFWPGAVSLDYEQAGVWSLGYPAAKTEWSGTAMPLQDRATNVLTLLDAHGIGEFPLVFVVHSMGGLLVKQMLRHATEHGEPGWKRISRATKGIAFLATPNSGSRIADWMMFFSLARASSAVQDLQHNSAGLRDLNLWFRHNVQQLGCRVLVFYEKLALNKVIVVDEASADPGIHHVYPIPLDENHDTICKPASVRALQYLKVKQFLAGLVPERVKLPVPGPAPDVAQQIAAVSLDNVGGWKRNEINALAWSPCSRYLAAAADDGTIRVWRPFSEDLLLTIVAHHGPVKSVCWAPGSDALASCSADGSVATWTFPQGEQRFRWEGDDDWARALAWASEGTVLACGYANGVVRTFDPRSGTALGRARLHDGRVRGVAIDSAARLLASGGTDGLIQIRDLRTGAPVAEIAVSAMVPGARDSAQVLCLAWSPNGEQLALGILSGHLALVDTLTWRIVRIRKVCRDSILSLAWLPVAPGASGSPQVVFGSADRSVTSMPIEMISRCATADARSGLVDGILGEQRRWTHSGSVRAVACAPDGKAIASGSTDETIKVGATHSLVELRVHQFQVRCAAVSPDRRFIATGSVGRRVSLFGTEPVTHRWSFEGTSEVLVLEACGKSERLVEKRREAFDEYIRCIAWSPDGKLLAVGGDDRIVRLLDAEFGHASPLMLAEWHDGPIQCVAWALTGDRILSCSGSRWVVWEVETGRKNTRHVPCGQIVAAAWEASGQRFATVSDDGALIVWDQLEPTVLGKSGSEVKDLSWSPDGKFIVCAGAGSHVEVWDAIYGRVIVKIPVTNGARSIAWDNGAMRWAFSTGSGSVIVVSSETWQQIEHVKSLPPTHRSLCLSFGTQPTAADLFVSPELQVTYTPLA